MTSLTDVYNGDVGSVVDHRRRLLGTALFLVGAGIVVAAIAVATTGLREVFGLGLYESREVAGLLAGLGLPGVFVGIFVVLPAGRTVRAAAAIGASLALLGVSLFAYAYPDRWLMVDPTLTIATILLYSLGTLTTVWCMFAALATLKMRNDPGGTVRIEITEEGTVRIIETGSVSASGSVGSIPGFGSVGLVGSDPDGDVETQTNRPTHAADGGTGVTTGSDGGTEVFSSGSSARGSSSAGSSAGQAGPTSGAAGSPPAGAGRGEPTDRGGQDRDYGRPNRPHPNATSDGGAQILEDPRPSDHTSPDEYCGNCGHFEYVHVDGELAPYCGLTDALMEDMDACGDWSQVR